MSGLTCLFGESTPWQRVGCGKSGACELGMHGFYPSGTGLRARLPLAVKVEKPNTLRTCKWNALRNRMNGMVHTDDHSEGEVPACLPCSFAFDFVSDTLVLLLLVRGA